MKHPNFITGLLALIILTGFNGTVQSQDKVLANLIPVLSETAEVLQPEHIQLMQTSFNSKPHNRYMQNAVTVTKVDELALDRAIVADIDDSFSNKLDDWSATNQKRSGRCWLFAGTNLLRVGAMKKMNIKDFEFSQSYLFFWDKIERANYFLEAIIDTAERPNGDRIVDFLLDNVLGDGGQWNMFVSLVRKYGLVPKSVMPESQSSSDSRTMNNILQNKLREGARHLRDLHKKGTSIKDLRKAKHQILIVIYRILSIHMGLPPKSFDWQWRDKDNQFHREGRLTPQEFAKKYVTLDLDEYVLSLIHI